MEMPTGAQARTDVDVRAHYGRERSHIVARREEDGNRQRYVLLVWLLAMTFCAVVAHHQSGYRSWLWGTLGVAGFAGAMRSGSKMFLSGGRGQSVLVVSAVALLLLMAALGGPSTEDEAWTPMQMLVLMATLITVIGVWLLIRQWTWGEWLAWVAPLVFAAVVSFVVTSGAVLHVLYANALGLETEDLDVPAIGQALSAARLLSFLSLALFVPAAWGIAKHVHVPFLRPGEHLSIPLYVLAQTTVISLVAVLAVSSANNAAGAVKAAAEGRKSAPAYFGVEPEWTCVEPTTPKEKLNSQGSELNPERSYLSFGVSGGEVVLWDTSAAAPFKVPMRQVRLLRAKDPRAACEFQARQWWRK